MIRRRDLLAGATGLAAALSAAIAVKSIAAAPTDIPNAGSQVQPAVKGSRVMLLSLGRSALTNSAKEIASC